MTKLSIFDRPKNWQTVDDPAIAWRAPFCNPSAAQAVTDFQVPDFNQMNQGINRIPGCAINDEEGTHVAVSKVESEPLAL
ncbi:MAG: hypothetical protein LM513_00080 [Nitrospira sp.]|nr:hypothetical protein [Nitrospira sp.]